VSGESAYTWSPSFTSTPRPVSCTRYSDGSPRSDPAASAGRNRKSTREAPPPTRAPEPDTAGSAVPLRILTSTGRRGRGAPLPPRATIATLDEADAATLLSATERAPTSTRCGIVAEARRGVATRTATSRVSPGARRRRAESRRASTPWLLTRRSATASAALPRFSTTKRVTYGSPATAKRGGPAARTASARRPATTTRTESAAPPTPSRTK